MVQGNCCKETARVKTFEVLIEIEKYLHHTPYRISKRKVNLLLANFSGQTWRDVSKFKDKNGFSFASSAYADEVMRQVDLLSVLGKTYNDGNELCFEGMIISHGQVTMASMAIVSQRGQNSIRQFSVEKDLRRHWFLFEK